KCAYSRSTNSRTASAIKKDRVLSISLASSSSWPRACGGRDTLNLKSPKIISTLSPPRQYSLVERMEGLELLLTATGMDAPEDRERTVEAAKAGDPAAFERLMRQHERLVLATALRLMGNLEDAQDVAQEVFWRLHRNLRKV